MWHSRIRVSSRPIWAEDVRQPLSGGSPMTNAEARGPGPMVELDGVDVFYGPVQALFNVRIEVMPGETVVVLGGNASGKSTTLKSVLGLVRIGKGEVR